MNSGDIEEYLLCLGKLAVMIRILSQEQQRYVDLGILTDGESELAGIIKWNCDRLIVSVGDQVRSVGTRTPRTWDETIEYVKKILTKEME